ncbi:MAG: 30S ribosomal protein S8 [Phycisphaerales bacterium]|nr:30S ribosomal protein S8 [Phycisphaerales bacterium]
MMWSDPIADMLTRIRNAARARRQKVTIPASKVKVGIADVLKREGYINDFDVVEDGLQGTLRIALKYGPRGEDLFHTIQRESRPGRRSYIGHDEIPRILDGLGIAILSTSEGVLSDRTCRERRIGGELLCTVY